MKVGISMICHNRGPMTRVVVHNMKAMIREHVSICIVDDASTDMTPELLAGFVGRRLVVLTNTQQQGAYASYNRAMAYNFEERDCDVSILMDNDMLVPLMFHSMLTGTLEALRPARACVAALVVNDRNCRRAIDVAAYTAGRPYQSRAIGGGHVVCIPRQMFNETGGFPENRQSFTFGDARFYGAARAKGWQTWVDPRVIVFALDWNFYVDDEYERIKAERRHKMAVQKTLAAGNKPMTYEEFYTAKMRGKSRIANE